MNYNETLSFTLTDIRFDDLPQEVVYDTYKDGRVFSHFIERWIPKIFPLKWISGCQSHDFVDIYDRQYDEKTFTRNGCKYMPSYMVGKGRKFNEQLF